jgi:hypothetical protein
MESCSISASSRSISACSEFFDCCPRRDVEEDEDEGADDVGDEGAE